MDDMPESPDQTAAHRWNPDPVIDWLLVEGRLLPDMDELIKRLGQELLAAGVPLWRLRLSMRTLHPLVVAVSSVWERDSGPVMRIESPHGMERRLGYFGSPLETMVRSGLPFRRKLDDTLSEDDHEVLHEMKARGATDYYGRPMPLTEGMAPTLVFVTDAADGFSPTDIVGFDRITAVMAPIAEVLRLKRVSAAVAEAYLGPRTGRRVLDGQITRGHIETIHAAILFSDIRDWTGLNSRLPAETTQAMANRYFEVIVGAVEDQDGEILKFMGDGVLAVFPVSDDDTDGKGACTRALTAARQSLDTAGDLDPPLDLDFGIGLHFGDVLYGNIGSETRIDFTVLGQAVNTASRIEGLCKSSGEPVLYSQDFADHLATPSRIVEKVVLKGHESASAILTAAGDL